MLMTMSSQWSDPSAVCIPHLLSHQKLDHIIPMQLLELKRTKRKSWKNGGFCHGHDALPSWTTSPKSARDRAQWRPSTQVWIGAWCHWYEIIPWYAMSGYVIMWCCVVMFSIVLLCFMQCKVMQWNILHECTHHWVERREPQHHTYVGIQKLNTLEMLTQATQHFPHSKASYCFFHVGRLAFCDETAEPPCPLLGIPAVTGTACATMKPPSAKRFNQIVYIDPTVRRFQSIFGSGKNGSFAENAWTSPSFESCWRRLLLATNLLRNRKKMFAENLKRVGFDFWTWEVGPPSWLERSFGVTASPRFSQVLPGSPRFCKPESSSSSFTLGSGLPQDSSRISTSWPQHATRQDNLWKEKKYIEELAGPANSC